MATLKQNHPGESEESMTCLRMRLDTVAFKVIVNPKILPEVEDGKVYSLDHSANLSVVTMTEDGKGYRPFSEPTNATLKSGGDAFRRLYRKNASCIDLFYKSSNIA